MSLLSRIFSAPELQSAPPVLVDVGAAGGLHGAWRAIARFSIGVGFEPDAREAPPLSTAQRQFRRWIFCPELALPHDVPGEKADLFLTASPQCSSTLRPREDALREWAFAGFFSVMETRRVAARALTAALQRQGLGRVDWLKCDTQGLDLRLFQSLPADWRARVLAAEFEPGIIDAYDGEDKLPDVLDAMAAEPFWLADMRVGGTARGRLPELARDAGGAARWLRRLGPQAPGWANVRYLRNFHVRAEALDRRAHLLGWVFARAVGQHAEALSIAALGRDRFGAEFFADMIATSRRELRWALWRAAPAAILRRLRRR